MLRVPRVVSSSVALSVAIAGALSLVTACAPQAGTLEDGLAAAGAGGGQQGANTSLGDGFDPSTGSGGGGGGIDKASQCAGTSEEPHPIPVNMFVTVDKSGSMKDNDKLKKARNAFTSFFSDPSASSLNVALRFWPASGCDSNSCNVDACASPQVALGPLSDPNHVEALVQKFQAESPNGPTPMSAALGGAIQWGEQYLASKNGTEKVVVVLLTDGAPNGCDENIGHIAKIADEGYQSSKIVTFAVGFPGSLESQMNEIATAGHSDKAFLISNNAEAELLAALKQIQQSQLACTYEFPKGSDPAKKPDPNKVNVSYTPGGKAPSTLGQVANEAACGPNGGWYYDNPGVPTSINLCPSTCTAVQADEKGKVEIVLGCSTTPA